MRERPILFSAPMVRAILDGRKTQTRRIVKPQPPAYIDELHGNDLRGRAPYRLEHDETGAVLGSGFQDDNDVFYKCPYGIPGDRLWVRETWCRKLDDGCFVYNAEGNLDASCCHYRADGYHVAKDDGDGGTEYTKSGREASPWSPSIHMPRWASRITLEVVAVRVERLQDITADDAKSEGVEVCKHFADANKGHPLDPHRVAFAWLWNTINGSDAWIANPWVWVVEFKKLEKS